MIGSLRGTLAERVARSEHQVEVLVEAGGVGYRVLVPAGSAARAGEVGGESFLWVHTHVREDALVLYGFPSRQERDCFELLLAAHGVGPALAATVVSVLSPAALRRAVLSGDADALALVPGIGKKTAQRLVLELAPRFEAVTLGLEAGAGGSPAGAEAPAAGGAGHPRREEVRAALTSLGYGAEEVRSVVARLGDEAPEEMLRQALRELAAAR